MMEESMVDAILDTIDPSWSDDGSCPSNKSALSIDAENALARIVNSKWEAIAPDESINETEAYKLPTRYGAIFLSRVEGSWEIGVETDTQCWTDVPKQKVNQ